jgi:sRNA-binding carbon storage regulator CsrA
MVVLTAAEGEAIVIDGHIRLRILAIHEDEACFEINFPEFLRCENSTSDEQKEKLSRWPASSA